eukprot:1137828-Pelagomonas_calceolata.AAC.7
MAYCKIKTKRRTRFGHSTHQKSQGPRSPAARAPGQATRRTGGHAQPSHPCLQRQHHQHHPLHAGLHVLPMQAGVAGRAEAAPESEHQLGEEDGLERVLGAGGLGWVDQQPRHLGSKGRAAA